MLVRKFISHRLNSYYSQPSQSVVGGVSAPLNLHWGRFYWLHTYKKLYKQNHGQWLTPVELFQPYYTRTIVNWMRELLEHAQTPHIVELGGGRGTNAKIVLETLKREHPAIFDKVQYTLIDSSTSLIELQQETLSGLSADKVHFRQLDLHDVASGKAELLPYSVEPTVVIALEVLDNLPHDKIRIRNGVVEQAEIVRVDTKEPLPDKDLDDQSIQLEEAYKPLNDLLIQDVLAIAPQFMPRRGILWIPSVACGLLRQLKRDRPQSSLLMADFDWLPAGDFTPGHERRSLRAHKGEPIVTCMDDVDHLCYLQAPILSDILFPTDFHMLAGFSRKIWKDKAHIAVNKQRDFIYKYGPDEVKATSNRISGFSPLVSDFDNCSVLSITNPLYRS
jgi:hypothetical protein